MPRRFELGALRLMCQQCVDREGDEAISTVEWNRMISTAWADLYSVVSSSGLRYFETASTITTTGATSYIEPSDHLSTVGVDYVDSAGRRRPLRELMAQERGMSGLTGDAIAWSLDDDRLYLYPVPPAGQTYEWLYIQQPIQLTGEDDDFVVDVVTPDGEAFVMWGVAAMALHKEGSETRPAREEREAARRRVEDWALLRSINSLRRPVHEGENLPGWEAEYSRGGGWDG
jgi:hypothetical protein